MSISLKSKAPTFWIVIQHSLERKKRQICAHSVSKVVIHVYLQEDYDLCNSSNFLPVRQRSSEENEEFNSNHSTQWFLHRTMEIELDEQVPCFFYWKIIVKHLIPSVKWCLHRTNISFNSNLNTRFKRISYRKSKHIILP